jgi:hypothetical protein
VRGHVYFLPRKAPFYAITHVEFPAHFRGQAKYSIQKRKRRSAKRAIFSRKKPENIGRMTPIYRLAKRADCPLAYSINFFYDTSNNSVEEENAPLSMLGSEKAG